LVVEDGCEAFFLVFYGKNAERDVVNCKIRNYSGCPEIIKIGKLFKKNITC
jgi:hypothetical protein